MLLDDDFQQETEVLAEFDKPPKIGEEFLLGSNPMNNLYIDHSWIRSVFVTRK